MSGKTAKSRKKPRNKVTYLAAPLPSEGVVRLPSLLAVSGMSKTRLYDGIKAGEIPPGKLLSPRLRVWPVADIREWLESIGA